MVRYFSRLRETARLPGRRNERLRASNFNRVYFRTWPLVAAHHRRQSGQKRRKRPLKCLPQSRRSYRYPAESFQSDDAQSVHADPNSHGIDEVGGGAGAASAANASEMLTAMKTALCLWSGCADWRPGGCHS